MRSNKGRDTKPELAVRRLLHAAGLRYRVNYTVLPRRTADIAFTRAKVAVFIDGCYWHGCAEHYQRPASNMEFWDAKVAANRARDLETTARLGAAGWTVLRFWEHEDAAEVAIAIALAVRST
ncbi:very short patch repair endonuclease [Gryllotalpicola daejeonensis]|uniref:Very short patch repair endonuclease n=2 Tax=Gryllotalpicola daejeonensis TaxID=993087 RepID=A0ABP7ZLA2_9MICO